MLRACERKANPHVSERVLMAIAQAECLLATHICKCFISAADWFATFYNRSLHELLASLTTEDAR